MIDDKKMELRVALSATELYLWMRLVPSSDGKAKIEGILSALYRIGYQDGQADATRRETPQPEENSPCH